MERSSKRSRSATRPAKTAGKRKHSAKSASVSSYNRKVSKVAAARAVANAVTMGFMGIEKKFLDTARTDILVTNAANCSGGEFDPDATSGPGGGSGGCVGCLSCPAQGDTEQSRDGKRIVIDAVMVKGHIKLDQATNVAPFASAKVFVAIVLDTQTNGNQLNSEDVFKNLGGSDALVDQPMKNLLFGKRFRILKSQVFDVTPSGPVVGAGGTVLSFNAVKRDFDWYIPFKGGLPVNLNAGTTADVANVIDNSIHVIALSTVDTAAIGYNARIWFQG